MDDLIGFFVVLCLMAIVLPIVLAAATLFFIVSAAVSAVLGLLALWAKRKAENSNPNA